MNAFESLMSYRWIVRDEDKERYYKVKDGLPFFRKFIAEKLGAAIVINPQLIKIEKIPDDPQPWMGIGEFGSVLEYEYFCFLLLYLEDMEKEEQFILSELTDFLQTNMEAPKADWTLYACRRQFIRVLKFAVTEGLILINDGDQEGFANDQTREVLYENTGRSRYFACIGIESMEELKPEKLSGRRSSSNLAKEAEQGSWKRENLLLFPNEEETFEVEFLPAEGFPNQRSGEETSVLSKGLESKIDASVPGSISPVSSEGWGTKLEQEASDEEVEMMMENPKDERGVARRQRVYRKLLYHISVHREQGEDPDFDYIKNYANIIRRDLDFITKAQLHLHKNSAFVVMGENSRLGIGFPENNNACDIALLLCHKIQQRQKRGLLHANIYECIALSKVDFAEMMEEIKTQYDDYFSKGFREKTMTDLTQDTMDYMREKEMLRWDEESHRLIALPLCGKVAGFFPQMESEKENHKEENVH